MSTTQADRWRRRCCAAHLAQRSTRRECIRAKAPAQAVWTLIGAAQASHDSRARTADPLTAAERAAILAILQERLESDGASSIVAAALGLWLSQPFKPAIDVLDAAVQFHRGADLDTEFEWLELAPGHPFAELLRRAFAPALNAEDVFEAVWGSSNDELKTGAMREAWSQVIVQFAQRYGVWQVARGRP